MAEVTSMTGACACGVEAELFACDGGRIGKELLNCVIDEVLKFAEGGHGRSPLLISYPTPLSRQCKQKSEDGRERIISAQV